MLLIACLTVVFRNHLPGWNKACNEERHECYHNSRWLCSLSLRWCVAGTGWLALCGTTLFTHPSGRQHHRITKVGKVLQGPPVQLSTYHPYFPTKPMSLSTCCRGCCCFLIVHSIFQIDGRWNTFTLGLSHIWKELFGIWTHGQWVCYSLPHAF